MSETKKGEAGMIQSRRGRSVETLFVLIVFCVFMVASLVLVMIGANVYRGVVEDTNANNALRSSFSYLANKVRSADSEGGVHVVTTNGLETLVMDAEYGGTAYRTYIYFEDGYLKELFALRDQEFDPGMGEKVVQTEPLQMREEGGLLVFTSANGQRLSVHPSSEPL